MLLSKKILSLPVTAILALNLFSCAGVSHLTAERPKDEASHRELKRELSRLNITIEASANELSDTLNRSIDRNLYSGITRMGGVTADIRRNGRIVVVAADDSIFLTFPVSMSVSYGMLETPAITTSLKFKLNPGITPDWKIKVDTYYMGLSDNLPGKVGIGPLSVRPRSIVEEATQTVQRSLSELVSRKLNEKFPLKARVAKVWDASRKAIQLDRYFNAWLEITPGDVLLYPLYARNNMVKLGVGLNTYAELVVGPEPPARAPVPLPNLKLVSGGDRTFRVALNTDLFFRDILKTASARLLNKEIGSDGKSVILKDLDLYGNGDRLVVKVEATGSFDGIFYLTCRPVIDPRTNVFSVEDVDFDMQTRSLLLKSADWLLHGTIRDSIREKLNMDLTQRLAQARDMAGNAVARVNLAKNITLAGNIGTVKLSDVIVQRDRISIQVCTEGDAAVVFH